MKPKYGWRTAIKIFYTVGTQDLHKQTTSTSTIVQVPKYSIHDRTGQIVLENAFEKQ